MDKRRQFYILYLTTILPDTQIYKSSAYTYTFEFLAKWMPKVNKISNHQKTLLNTGLLDNFISNKSQCSLDRTILEQWVTSFRAYDWKKAFPAPEVNIK